MVQDTRVQEFLSERKFIPTKHGAQTGKLLLCYLVMSIVCTNWQLSRDMTC